MPVYSHSKLATYENCPQQYKLRYVDRIELPEGGEGIEAFLGSRVHEVLEKLHKELILTKLNNLDDLLAYYRDQWDKNWHDNVVIVKKGFKKDHYRDTGEKAIANYYSRYHPFNDSTTLATESLLTFRIDSYTIKGFIDRLSRRGNAVYEIHDYKTSGSLPTQEKFDNDRQLALYQIGVRERFRDAKDIRLIWHYLTFDQEFTSARTEAQLKDLKKQVVLLIKAIEKDTRFEPVESALCDWCDYPEYCPARKHEIKVSDMPPNKYLKEKGVTLVNKFASIKAEIKELQDKIEGRREELDQVSQAAVEYAKKEEITNITGSDFILKVAEFTERCFPRSGQEGREELEMFIKKMGIWEQVSGLTLSKLSKLIDDETLKSKIRNGLLKFAEEEDKVSIRLMKRRDTDE